MLSQSTCKIGGSMGLPGAGSTIALGKPQGIVLETEDIAKEKERLEASGVATEKIDDTPWGKFMWLKDEDGNGLCWHEK